MKHEEPALVDQFRDAANEREFGRIVDLMVECPSLSIKSLLDEFAAMPMSFNDAQRLVLSKRESDLYDSIADLLIDDDLVAWQESAPEPDQLEGRPGSSES